MSASFKERLGIAQSLLTCVAIIVGGLWGMNEYLEKKNQDRISKSFEFVAKFRSSEDVRLYGEFADSIAATSVLRDKLLKATEKSQRITELHTDKERDQLKRTVEQYENAAVCVLVNHCDKNVIAAFMAKEANATYVIGYGVINKIRTARNDESYASELEQIRSWYCTLPESANHKLKSVSWCG
ncbi:MAG: hypothetical protein WC073_02565 [Sterolibacterium sp.]